VDRKKLFSFGLSESFNIVPNRRNIQSATNHVLDEYPDGVWVNFTIANSFTPLPEAEVNTSDSGKETERS